jgi:SnoaL-like domain
VWVSPAPKLAGEREAGWTTGRSAEFWKAPDLRYIASIVTDDVVGYWPGGRVVRGRAEYMKALEEFLAVVPDLWLDVREHIMSADGEFGFTRWVMHATGADGAFELDGMERARVRDGLICENYVFFDTARLQRSVGGASASDSAAK